MVAKVALFVCALALVSQSIAGQCCRAPCGAATSYAPASGGSFPVSSFSPNAPSGISVMSQNEYSGDLNICGGLPFLGTVALEGCLPTSGCSKVCYGCGCGEVAIQSEGIGAPCGCGRGAYY